MRFSSLPLLGMNRTTRLLSGLHHSQERRRNQDLRHPSRHRRVEGPWRQHARGASACSYPDQNGWGWLSHWLDWPQPLLHGESACPFLNGWEMRSRANGVWSKKGSRGDLWAPHHRMAGLGRLAGLAGSGLWLPVERWLGTDSSRAPACRRCHRVPPGVPWRAATGVGQDSATLS